MEHRSFGGRRVCAGQLACDAAPDTRLRGARHAFPGLVRDEQDDGGVLSRALRSVEGRAPLQAGLHEWRAWQCRVSECQSGGDRSGEPRRVSAVPAGRHGGAQLWAADERHSGGRPRQQRQLLRLHESVLGTPHRRGLGRARQSQGSDSRVGRLVLRLSTRRQLGIHRRPTRVLQPGGQQPDHGSARLVLDGRFTDVLPESGGCSLRHTRRRSAYAADVLSSQRCLPARHRFQHHGRNRLRRQLHAQRQAHVQPGRAAAERLRGPEQSVQPDGLEPELICSRSSAGWATSPTSRTTWRR